MARVVTFESGLLITDEKKDVLFTCSVMPVIELPFGELRLFDNIIFYHDADWIKESERFDLTNFLSSQLFSEITSYDQGKVSNTRPCCHQVACLGTRFFAKID